MYLGLWLSSGFSYGCCRCWTPMSPPKGVLRWQRTVVFWWSIWLMLTSRLPRNSFLCFGYLSVSTSLSLRFQKRLSVSLENLLRREIFTTVTVFCWITINYTHTSRIFLHKFRCYKELISSWLFIVLSVNWMFMNAAFIRDSHTMKLRVGWVDHYTKMTLIAGRTQQLLCIYTLVSDRYIISLLLLDFQYGASQWGILPLNCFLVC